MEEEKKATVKVVQKSIQIMKLLGKNPQPMGVNEMGKLASLHPSTVYRILKTLTNLGWVYQGQNGKYMNGNKILRMSQQSGYTRLKEIAYYTMKKHSQAELQAMNLVVGIHQKCFILQQARTDKIVDYVPLIDSELPVYASACGKVLLAGLPDEMIREILNEVEFTKLTAHTIIRKSDLLMELQSVRKKGYALDIHESLEQGNCIAVPVRNDDGRIIAALSFSGFIGDFEEKEITYYFSVLKEASREISQKLNQYLCEFEKAKKIRPM
jgi:DNA-binding IclR family transcriptional regulator